MNRLSRRGLACRLRRNCCCLCIGIDHGNDFAGNHGIAVLFKYLGQYTCIGRGKFKHDLIGFYIDQILIASNRLARLFMPI